MGELLLSDMDPAPEGRVCVAGERPDGLTEESELDSASGSCCEAVAGGKSKIQNENMDTIYLFVYRICLLPHRLDKKKGCVYKT